MLTGISESTVAAPGRVPVYQVIATVNTPSGPVVQDWTKLVEGLKVERELDDLPEELSLVSGVASAQASFTLSFGPVTPDETATSADLSPFVGSATSVSSLRNYGTGTRIVVSSGFAGGALLPTFTGEVESLDFRSDGTVGVVALDGAARLRSEVDLEPVSRLAATTLAGNDIPAVAIAEHLLRSGGYLRTPAARKGALLSLPSLFPEIGYHASAFDNHNGVFESNFHTATNPGLNGNSYGFEDVIRGDQWLNIEAFFKGGPFSSEIVLVDIAADYLPISIRVNTARRLKILIPGYDSGWSTTVLPSSTSSWFHLGIAIGLGKDEVRFVLNGAEEIILNTGVSTGYVPTLFEDAPRTITLRRRFEGLQVWQTKDAPTDWSHGWTPNYTKDTTGAFTFVQGIPRGIKGTSWSLIQELAQGIGAVARFQEDGSWLWREAARRRTIRNGPPVKEVTDKTNLKDLGFSIERSTVKRSVTVPYQPLTARNSSVASPLWKLSGELVVPAASTRTFYYRTDGAVFGLKAPSSTAVLTSTSVSPFRAVREATPTIAANQVQCKVWPTSDGFALQVKNLEPRAIRLWDPVAEEDCFILHGLELVENPEEIYVAQSNSTVTDDLDVGTNPWRQTYELAQDLATNIALETSTPIFDFDKPQIILDPRLQLEDVVSVRSTGIIDPAINTQILGISHDFESWETSLNVRPVQPPTGWILGLAGRAELGATTLLNL